MAKKASSKKKTTKKAAKKAPSKNRGKILKLTLAKPITFNEQQISKALVELDHINFGINKKTKELNKKRRLNFTLKDIEKFIRKLDGEDIVPTRYEGTWSVFLVVIDCPVKDKHEDKEFLMIFKTNYKDTELIHTITLYPA